MQQLVFLHLFVAPISQLKLEPLRRMATDTPKECKKGALKFNGANKPARLFSYGRNPIHLLCDSASESELMDHLRELQSRLFPHRRASQSVR